MNTDVLIVGAGVVGLAVAANLAQRGMSVVVLERHDGFGREASSRNSEVIHAGMYYPTGSRKAELCVRGNRSTYAWCSAHMVPHRRLGKFIVATDDTEVRALEQILTRGRENGMRHLDWIESAAFRDAEPNVRAVAALWSPDTGIIDSHAFMSSLETIALASDAVLAYGHRYVDATSFGAGYGIRYVDSMGEESHIDARRVVNAAGLGADEIAEGMGIDVDSAGYRLRFVRGSYFRLAESKRDLVSHLIYPVPPAGLSGLGIHITVDLAGSLRLGPDVELLTTRAQDYSVQANRASVFADAASRYLVGFSESDLRPDQAGIRCRRVSESGAAVDFVIAEESNRGLPGWVNLVGIESPGLTCALEIANEVGELLA
ncbi:MAG: NAD(P)/FAD-dependent oxidoreductase [Gemmatimonadota bacterium]|nr:NAD(P)/FAD-dependent oxidoreductase [Gemmatimonadota bacterium]